MNSISVARSFVICLYGPDGSGKTTASRYLKKLLLAKYGVSSSTLWLRNNHYLAKIPLAISKLLRCTHYLDVDGCTVGYYSFSRFRALSRLYIICRLMDTLLCYLFVLLPRLLFTRSALILDRYVPDIIIDTSLYADCNLVDSFLFKLFMYMQPKSSHLLFLTSDQQHLCDARPENKIDPYFTSRLNLYKSLYSRVPSGYICNNRSISDFYCSIDDFLATIAPSFVSG